MILAAGRAGTQILSTAQLADRQAAAGGARRQRRAAGRPRGHRRLRRRHADRRARNGVGVGALAVGNVKFKTEHELLAAMRDAEPRRYHRRRRGVRGRPAACRRPEPVLICALSGRALAQSARAAGFAPIVLDAFGDLDTRAAAERWRRVPVDRRWRLRRGAAAGAPRRGWRRRRSRWSGAPASSARPALLARARRGPASCWGNRAGHGARGQGPVRLRRRCRAARHRRTPRSAPTRPRDRDGWLCKRARRRRRRACPPGRSAAAARPRLVLAAPGARPARLGPARRRRPARRACWPSASNGSDAGSGRRFRFAGAAGAGRRCSPTAAAPARGGRDGLGRGTTACAASPASTPWWRPTRVTVLEVNPRPGASLDAYELGPRRPTCSASHVAACRGRLPARWPARHGAAAGLADRLRRPRPRACRPGVRLAGLGRPTARPPGHRGSRRGGPICTVRGRGQRSPARLRAAADAEPSVPHRHPLAGCRQVPVSALSVAGAPRRGSRADAEQP